MPETHDDNHEIWPLDDPKEPTTGGSTVTPNPVEVQTGLPRGDDGDDQQ
jgi:hypothetical protein